MADPDSTLGLHYSQGHGKEGAEGVEERQWEQDRGNRTDLLPLSIRF